MKNPERAAKIQELLLQGLKGSEITKRLKLGKSVVDYYKRRYGLTARSYSAYRDYTKVEDTRPVTRLRQARSYTGITLRHACALTDLPYTQVHLVEAGKLTPTPPMREKLPRLYRIPEEVLFADWNDAISVIKAYSPLYNDLPDDWKPPKLQREPHKRRHPNEEDDDD